MTAASNTPDLLDSLSGTLSDENEINRQLRLARERTILISPATVGRLQPGCSASFTLVWVTPRECYPVGKSEVATGQWAELYAPGRVALMRIAAAAGVLWDSDRSGRTDDRRHPHVVQWRAVGAWLSLDGSALPLVGDSQLDLREGSDAALTVMEKAKGTSKLTPEQQLRAKRTKILELAQTGAKLRAIRDLGITQYTLEELQKKPFCVVRAFFDGHDEDPEMERENKRAIRAKYLGGAAVLFPPLPAHVEPRLLGRGNAAIPDAEILDEAEASEEGKAAWQGGVAAPPAAPPQAAKPAAPPAPVAPTGPMGPGAPAAAGPRPAAPAARPPAPPATPPARSGFVIPWGRTQGTPIEDATDRDLDFCIDRLSKNLNENASRFPDKDEKLLDAMEAEVARRGAALAGEAKY